MVTPCFSTTLPVSVSAQFPCCSAARSTMTEPGRIAATIGAAAMMRLENDLGALEPGKLADIIATEENPLDDIGALRSVHFVMKEGRIAKHEA